jgi:hypothetical protein
MQEKIAGGVALSLLWLGQCIAAEVPGTDNDFLACPSACAKVTNSPQAVAPPKVHVSFSEAPDGYVRMRVVFGTDGKVRAVNVLRQVGSNAMVEQIRDAVARWQTHATGADGKPVETVSILQQRYRNGSRIPIRNDFRDAGKQAGALLAAGKRDEAERILQDIAQLPNQTYDERLFLAGLLASIEIDKGEFRAASDLLDEPCNGLFDSQLNKMVPAQLARRLVSLRIQAALGMGDVAEALVVLAKAQARGDMDADGRLAAAVANVRADIDKSAVIPVSAAIPAQASGDGFFFTLYRRHFDFHLLSGALKDYSLSCPQGVVEKSVDEEVRHDLPDDWGTNCQLFVTGTPGTTFQVREYKN